MRVTLPVVRIHVALHQARAEVHRLHQELLREIDSMHDQGWSYARIAKEMGVDRSRITQMRKKARGKRPS
jgi:IS30 family transposase